MKRRSRVRAPVRFPEVLDAAQLAAFLHSSRSTVIALMKSGALAGRKVGRKWITTKAAALRFVESAEDASLMDRARRGDRDAVIQALDRGKAKLTGGGGA